MVPWTLLAVLNRTFEVENCAVSRESGNIGQVSDFLEFIMAVHQSLWMFPSHLEAFGSNRCVQLCSSTEVLFFIFEETLFAVYSGIGRKFGDIGQSFISRQSVWFQWFELSGDSLNYK